MKIRSLAAFAVILFGGLSVMAQGPGLDNPVCNADFARLLVAGQVMESKSVVEPVKRIKILLRSADFLWQFDQPTARTYFAEAWKMADDRFKETGFEKKESGEKGNGMVKILPDQRMEVIRSISKKDADWSKRLAEQMLADYEKAAADRTGFDKDREPGDLLSLAQESLKTNPELSRYLFRRMMKYPLSVYWYFSFYSIYKTDPAFSDSLYSEALTAFRNESPRRLLFLSAYPFATERMIGVDKYSSGTDKPANLTPNPALEKQFMTTFFARVAAYAVSEKDINQAQDKNYQGEPVYMVSGVRELEPIVISQFPELLGQMTAAKAQAQSLISAEMQKQLDEKDKWAGDLGSTLEERIKTNEKAEANGKLTDFMIVRMVTWNDKTDEQFAMVLPWLDKIKDEKVRSETTNYFWFLRAKLAMKEKRFDEVEKYALKVPEVEHRALLMFYLAEIQAKNESDVASLFETLNGLSKLVRTASGSVTKAQMLMGLANMYEKVNHSVAIDELGESIRVTNALKDPDIFATSVTRQISGKEFTFFASFGTPGYDLEKTFTDLSKKDFELSLANAKALDDKYFRTLAVIAVAGTCAKNSKPAPKPKN